MTDENPNRLIWVETPVDDLSGAKAFYEKVRDGMRMLRP